MHHGHPGDAHFYAVVPHTFTGLYYLSPQLSPPSVLIHYFFLSPSEHAFCSLRGRVTLLCRQFVRSVMPAHTKGVIYALCAFLI